MAKKIDELYFLEYSANGYDVDFLEYSLIDSCLNKILYFQIPIKSVCVLGTATGKILKHIHEKLGVIPEGCELNKWAHSQTPKKYIKRVSNVDLKKYISLQLDKKKHFDLIFSNAFLYLFKKDLPVTFSQISQLCTYLHYDSSVTEDQVEDPYRNILESHKWWSKTLSQYDLREVSYGLYKSHCPPQFYKNEQGRISSTLVKKGEIVLTPKNYKIKRNKNKSNLIKISDKSYKARRMIFNGEFIYC
jgi:hypothetical protein